MILIPLVFCYCSDSVSESEITEEAKEVVTADNDVSGNDEVVGKHALQENQPSNENLAAGFEANDEQKLDEPELKNDRIHIEEEAIYCFKHYMEWFHEEIEYDKTSVQALKLSNTEFSIKFERTYRRLDPPLCQPRDCIMCSGSGKLWPDCPDTYSVKCAPCSYCKGTGREECREIVTQSKKLATLTFNGDKYSVSLLR